MSKFAEEGAKQFDRLFPKDAKPPQQSPRNVRQSLRFDQIMLIVLFQIEFASFELLMIEGTHGVETMATNCLLDEYTAERGTDEYTRQRNFRGRERSRIYNQIRDFVIGIQKADGQGTHKLRINNYNLTKWIEVQFVPSILNRIYKKRGLK